MDLAKVSSLILAELAGLKVWSSMNLAHAMNRSKFLIKEIIFY